jgi:hypothetical protein
VNFLFQKYQGYERPFTIGGSRVEDGAMLQVIKDTVGFVQWALGFVKGWLPGRKSGESWTHSVEAVEITRSRLRWYRETRTKGKT